MKSLLRWAGWLLPAALLQAGGTLSPARARQLAAVAIVVGNLLPVASVLAGLLTLGDVFLVYWCENVGFWLIGTVRVSTARWRTPSPGTALFFAAHYGLFTLGHGQVAMALAEESGGTVTGPWQWALSGLGIAVGHALSLRSGWFGNGERDVVSQHEAMVLPYARLVVLHVGVLAAGSLIARAGPGGAVEAATWSVALLCLGKTALDLGLQFLDARFARRTRPARLARPAGRHARVLEK